MDHGPRQPSSWASQRQQWRHRCRRRGQIWRASTDEAKQEVGMLMGIHLTVVLAVMEGLWSMGGWWTWAAILGVPMVWVVLLTDLDTMPAADSPLLSAWENEEGLRQQSQALHRHLTGELPLPRSSSPPRSRL